jgi:ribosome biogenesis GTPase
MSKRKLNQQQKRRIADNQAKVLDTPECSGLVLAHHGKTLEIEDSNANIIICSKRQNLGTVVTGDKVIWQLDTESNHGVVLKVEQRTTLLSRPDARLEVHAVASNIDQMFVVIAPTPAPQQTTVDRYLIAAETENIQPILILNKEDLLDDHPDKQQVLEFFNQYKNIGMATLKVSTKEKQNLSELHKQLKAKISVFVGQSGVGKSSLIGTLIPQLDIKTGAISEQNNQGKHTTTTARLYHLENQGGSIIDSPGIREFPLWPLKPDTLAYGFIEFRPFLEECKFRNCLHTIEPGCALLNAASIGKISKARLLSYQKILATMQEQSNP